SFHGLWSVAGFCGAAMGALALWLNLDTKLHFLIISGIVLLMLIFSSRHLHKEAGEKARNKLVLKWPDKHLAKLGLLAFCGLLCEGCMFDWSGVYFKEVINAEEGMVAVGYMAFMGMLALGGLVCEKCANRLGSACVIQVCGGLIFSGLLLAVLFPSIYVGIFGFLLVGAGTSSVMPLTYNEVGKSKTFSSGIAL